MVLLIWARACLNFLSYGDPVCVVEGRGGTKVRYEIESNARIVLTSSLKYLQAKRDEGGRLASDAHDLERAWTDLKTASIFALSTTATFSSLRSSTHFAHRSRLSQQLWTATWVYIRSQIRRPPS